MLPGSTPDINIVLAGILSCHLTVLSVVWSGRNTLLSVVVFLLGLALTGTLFAILRKLCHEKGASKPETVGIPNPTTGVTTADTKKLWYSCVPVFFLGTIASYAVFTTYFDWGNFEASSWSVASIGLLGAAVNPNLVFISWRFAIGRSVPSGRARD
ncbi:hypothetical protein CDG81_19660 [Actinopolyspora erythraea]|uniref:Uncharacterized protein n=2 Tax=Actinopolyspora erythraea TaxID=414996 RepID=A0A099CZZ2_9ACTN|nr:hypothetical protein CDG81_19660 [Actinopolyspora erythraea]KGI79286.1 hypothetical protein IL38_24505 [Actinopolyspora erythraea]